MLDGHLNPKEIAEKFCRDQYMQEYGVEQLVLARSYLDLLKRHEDLVKNTAELVMGVLKMKQQLDSEQA